MGWRVEEEGGSECRPVIGRIRVEPSGEFTRRESGLTSLWCLRTRPSEQLAWEAEQMTAACLLVRSPACNARQLQTSIVQVVAVALPGSARDLERGLSGINRKVYVSFWHSRNQLAKCFSVGKRLTSTPISPKITRAVPTSIPSINVRSTPKAWNNGPAASNRTSLLLRRASAA